MQWCYQNPDQQYAESKYRNGKAPFLTASLVSHTLFLDTASLVSHTVLERRELSTWKGAVPFGPGDGAEPLANFTVEAVTVPGACEVVLAQR